MSVGSKTGLLPYNSSKNDGHRRSRMILSNKTMMFPNLVSPAPFTLRPFAGLYNPFPYGCSVLCNHPADSEAKDVVKKAKNAWVQEGRILTSTDVKSRTKSPLFDDHLVPEELFRRYTETDSRPVTPAPTLASMITKSSLRRCLTPEPVTLQPYREKTLLVLDLRRSHSQDTFSWHGTDEPSITAATVLQQSTSATLTIKTCSDESSIKKRKSLNKSKTPSVAEIKNDDSNINTLPVPDAEEALSTERSSQTEVDVVKRRGKKVKGKKSKKMAHPTGEKEFQGIPDPGETQVSAMDTESRAGSNRPSLTHDLEENADVEPTTAVKCENPIFNSFLDADTLKLYQRQLDQEVVDSEFDFKRKIALSEALRVRSVNCTRTSSQNEELLAVKKELKIPLNTTEKWFHVPRVFSRRSSRFELPMDNKVLLGITPLKYARKFVFPSMERLVLYNQIFNRHKEEVDEDEQQQQADRFIKGKNIVLGLGEVMGRQLSDHEAKEVKNLFEWQDDQTYDFRTFAGISAIYERIFGRNFIPHWPSQLEDPRLEVEQADFQTLDRKFQFIPLDSKILFILNAVREA